MARPQSPAANAADETLIEAFLHMMRAERGASPNTMAAYASDLREIAGFLAAEGASFVSCSRQDLEAFFTSRAENGLAPNSAARKLLRLKRFALFLIAEGLSRRRSRPAYRRSEGEAQPSHDAFGRGGRSSPQRRA